MYIFLRKLILWLVIIIKGAVIGSAGILPGLSGGVMMLVFGFYEPFMQLLAHPKTGIRKHWKMFIPFIIGVALGFWLTAIFLSNIFLKYEIQAISLFVGLVFGMFPAMFREAEKKGHTKGSWLGFGICAVVLLAVFEFLEFSTGVSVTPGFGWFIFCGVLWGMSMIIPGFNSSSLLIFLGLYLPMTTGLGSLDILVLIPWCLGIIIVLAFLSRAVNLIFSKYYNIASYCIMGTVLASTIPTIPVKFESTGQLLICIVMAVTGIVLAIGIDKLDKALMARIESRT